MDLPDNYSAYKGEEELSADAWIDQLSVHNRERTVQSPSMDHLTSDMAVATEPSKNTSTNI